MTSSSPDPTSFLIDILDPPLPGLNPTYRPSLAVLQEWLASSNAHRPCPAAIGNDWLMEDIAHYAAVWGAEKMLKECCRWVSWDLDSPSAAEAMQQEVQGPRAT